MARATLTVGTLTADNSATTIASIATTTPVSGAGNGVLLANTLDSMLVVVSTGTASTLTVNVGTTLFGQAVANFTVSLPATAGTYIIGPFHSALNQPGTSQIAVDFSSITGLTVGAFQLPGVY
jgi:hypothetical protein